MKLISLIAVVLISWQRSVKSDESAQFQGTIGSIMFADDKTSHLQRIAKLKSKLFVDQREIREVAESIMENISPNLSQLSLPENTFHSTRRGVGFKAFQGDNFGNGSVSGDQFTGGLMDPSDGGDVYSWGNNDMGQLGSGSVLPRDTPQLIPVLRNKVIVSVSSGSAHSIALSDEGLLYSWGRNSHGQLGLIDPADNSCTSPPANSGCTALENGFVVYPSSVTTPWGDQCFQISSKRDQNLANLLRGVTYGWGLNSAGQLATSDFLDRNLPTEVTDSAALRFVEVSAGGEHSIGITPFGQVYVWGSNQFGQLGQDTLGLGSSSIVGSSVPISVPLLKGQIVVAVAAGWAHCLAVTKNGQAWVWGRNNYGQLGVGDLIDRFRPVLLQGSPLGNGSIVGHVVGVAAGHSHSIWLNSAGIPFTAGRNDAGQLGVGNTINRNFVTQIAIPNRIWCDSPYGSQIPSTFQDLLCVGSKIRSFCGKRCLGTIREDCGASNLTTGLTPGDCEPLMPISNIGLQVEAGEYTSYMISTDYNLYAWGSNTNGQIGIGSTAVWGSYVPEPQLVTEMYDKNVTSVSSGTDFTIARADREVFYMLTSTPESGAVAGGTALDVIGRGYNTFLGNLSCRLTRFFNGTHSSLYHDIINASIQTIEIPAERFSNFRIRCITPDIRYKKRDGSIDLIKMSGIGQFLEGSRNLTVWWRGTELKALSHLLFIYTPLPGIISITPETGPIVGGSFIIILGYGFDRAIATDVRVRFGDDGDNWMRGCILSDTVISTVSAPSGPSDSGVMDFDGACNDLCPTAVAVPRSCKCVNAVDSSPNCVRGIVKSVIDPVNRASRRDRCPSCALIVGSVNVRVTLNGFDYTTSAVSFTYYVEPKISLMLPPPWLSPFDNGFKLQPESQYGGPSQGGTVVEFHGSGFSPAATGKAICMFGCSYSDLGQSIGPRCSAGTALHSLPLNGIFLDANRFRFSPPLPNAVWDIIHFGTWLMCPQDYNSSGCPSYNKSSGILSFVPRYDKLYAPSFRGYNQSTQVVTSCVESCESRVEYINQSLIRCTSKRRLLANATENVTVRIKFNGQDASPQCFATNCDGPAIGSSYFLYYNEPSVSRITPNGGPLNQSSFVFVTGSGFSRFAWFPRCQFGKQMATVTGNSTTFPGWNSFSFQTNTSAWIINDTLLVCYSPSIPANVLQVLQTEYGHRYLQFLAYDPTFSRALVENGTGISRVTVPFTISFNCQDYMDSAAIPFPRNQWPGTIVTSTNLVFILYPHPVLLNIVPSGGIMNGTTQVIVKGIGFQVYNEMGSWIGQFDPVGTVNKGTPNPNWFNSTLSTARPPYVDANVLGWPQRDRNVGFKYGPNQTTSIRCRFGNESKKGYMTTASSLFYGALLRYEPLYLYSVWADYLDDETLRCRAPAHTPNAEVIEVALNFRDYPQVSSGYPTTYLYYKSPVTERIKPSGGPIEGGTDVLIFGKGFMSFAEQILCRFGAEMQYDPFYDLYFPWDNTTTVAKALNDSVLVCKSPFRRTPINAPFGMSLNGQDYNMIQGVCSYNQGSNKTLVMWDNPAAPLQLVRDEIVFQDPNMQQPILNYCPYVFYPQPITFGLYPAGAPITGGANVRIYGRRFDIFSEDVRCKFGQKTVMWTQANDRPVGIMGRQDEINCYSAPHLIVTLSGPSVSCTLDCQIFPGDSSRCNMQQCSFNESKKLLGFKLGVAEIVGVRDVYGDINVLPHDIVIEDFRQSSSGGPKDIDVVFCIHCVHGHVSPSNIQESFEIISAVRGSTLIKQMKKYGLTGINSIEISSEPVLLMIALNGQDYSLYEDNFFTFYLNPSINSILPAGGPLIRYDIADSDHNQPTKIEISGTGFTNYDEDSLCKFDDFIVPATVLGDRLMTCNTPWPGVTFLEATCDPCILDVWVEVTLNGQDYSVSSGVNFRYYLQPTFATFSPLGGPVDGGTLVTFKGHGFNRFNDGSLRILWGVRRSFPEETSGGILAFDDFDPTPPEVAPLSTEYGILSEFENVSSTRGFLSTTFDGAQTILLNNYQGHRSIWDFEYAVISNQKCGAMDLPSTAAKVRLGYLPGDTRTKQATIQGQSLYFSGKSQGVLTGRYVITKAFDISRGASISMWLRRGNAASPLSCETPDPFDELNVMMRPEDGKLLLQSECSHPCHSAASLVFSLCSATTFSEIAVDNAYKVLKVDSFPLINKTISEMVFLVPKCDAGVLILSGNESLVRSRSFVGTSDINWLQIELYNSFPKGNVGRLLIPLDQFTDPAPGLAETNYSFQHCVCVPTTGCLTPPCPDSCDCFDLDNASCAISSVSASVVNPVQKLRTLICELPSCHDCIPKIPIAQITVEVRYIPDASPPTWAQIPTWRRISVFDVADVEQFTFYSQDIYRNQRGQRASINLNELTISSLSNSLVACPRNRTCYNRKARVMISQPDHGQGDFDNWALDDFTLETKGGIVSDTEIIAASPAAHLALPLSETQRQNWKKDGRFLGTYMRPIDIYIALNNQSYEQAGKQNFCMYPGQTKLDPSNPVNTITCENRYFSWDEPTWLFGTQVESTYTNWWEKGVVSSWGLNFQFQQVQSQQFFYYQHPTIDSVTPSGGPTSGGTYVTVFGQGFAVFSDPLRTPKCKFGHFLAESRVFGDTMMTCTTPATLDAGYADVVISLNEVDFTSPTMGIQYSVPFLFYGQPTIVSLTPESGPSRGGTLIVVVGTGFSQLPSQPACRFVGLNDPTVIMDVQGLFLNDTMIQCESPAIAYLCTPSLYCDQQTIKDPNWRGCNKWLSCPFAGVNGSAGCPSEGCLQYEADGTPTRRLQPGEDILFDTVIQLSLNAFCCVRDGNGRITDPCQPCTQGNVRCGCVGDFTTLDTDQDSTVSNTFTFYREAEINSSSTMSALSSVIPMLNGDTQNVITVIGKYFRNSSLLQCGYKDVQNNLNIRADASLESLTGTVYDSYYYLLSTQMLCTAPSFPGQSLETTGLCEVFLSLNGIDTTKPTSGGCPPDSCISLDFYTPESAEKRTRKIVATVVPIVVFLIYVYFQRQRYLKKNAKYVADTGGEWEKPSRREATHWQTENQVRKYGTQMYPLWRTSTDQLADLGVGIGLYFAYLKYMTKYFIIMSLMGIPSIVICSAGHAYPPSRTDATSAIRASIGSIGLGQTPTTLTIICVPGNGDLCAQMQDKDASFLLALLDCCICSVFIVATWRLKNFQEKAIVTIDEDTITAAVPTICAQMLSFLLLTLCIVRVVLIECIYQDYTVLVDNIPGDATDPDELRAFFSKYGEVADVAVGLNNGSLIELFQKRGKNQIALEEQAAKLKLYKFQALQLELKKMKKNQQKLDAKILGLRAKTDFKSVCAFITFNDDKGQQECLAAYSRNFFSNIFRSRNKQASTKKFRNKYNLIVEQSPEPSNIVWENLQHKGMETHVRTLIALLVAMVLLVSSFYLTLFLKALQDQLKVSGGDTICLDINVDDPGVQEFIRWSRYAQPTAKQGTAIYQAYLACYCGPYGKQLAAQPSFCNDYVINTYRLNALSIGSVAAVIAINAVLQVVLKSLAAFIKPHTISALERGIASRIFFAQWINTAIIVVLINADLIPYLPSTAFLYDAGYLTGTYSDTTEDWFVVVGAAVVGQSVSASIVPNIAVVVNWPVGQLKQALLQNRQMTQKTLNKLYEGAEYLLSARYAALLNILWVILTYNSAIPIMNFFGIVFFSTAYWCDKIALLRACKRPAQYDEKLAVLCTHMMSVGMIVHLVFSVWFFGYLTADTVVLPIIELIPLPQVFILRLIRKPAATVFFFLVGYIALEILARTFGPALVRYFMTQIGVEAEPEAQEGNPPFFEALENQEIQGLDTYNIKKNPRYRDAFSSDIQTDTAESDDEGHEEDDFGEGLKNEQDD